MDAVPGDRAAVAMALRCRVDTIRLREISRHRTGSVDPDLIDELTRCLVESILAPILAAIDAAHANDRQRELTEAAFELFELQEPEDA